VVEEIIGSYTDIESSAFGHWNPFGELTRYAKKARTPEAIGTGIAEVGLLVGIRSCRRRRGELRRC
jgi:hypothetical protein